MGLYLPVGPVAQDTVSLFITFPTICPSADITQYNHRRMVVTMVLIVIFYYNLIILTHMVLLSITTYQALGIP